MRSRLAKKRTLLRLLLILLGCACLIGGVYLISQRFLATKGTAAPPDVTLTISQDNPNPDEKKPDKTREYTVPADQPRTLLFESIGAEGFIQRVGVTQSNAIAAPSNVHYAGWYVNSVLPGQKGLSIIDGHVSGKYVPGIFANLKSAKEGDTFSIEFGDGTYKSFRVKSLVTLAEDQAAEALFSKDPSIESQLNLITCAGRFESSTQTYSDRTIVTSEYIADILPTPL